MAKNESFGLKEVADVMLIPLTDDLYNEGKMGAITATVGEGGVIEYTVNSKPVDPKGEEEGAIVPHYIFDSLKVSNIEMSSEDTSARGGKGNPELISWSYGKEVTFTMEDALLNMATLHLMFGAKEGVDTDEEGNQVSKVIDKNIHSLTIDANTFSTNYLLIGTTVLRSYTTGRDTPFVFVIPKAKINANGTLTMEADGDPSTFEMTVKALAQDMNNADSVLVQFIQPQAASDDSEDSEDGEGGEH